MSKLVTWSGATHSTINTNPTSDPMSGDFMKAVNKAVQFELGTGGGSCTVSIYGSLDGGAHYDADSALAALSLSGASNCQSWNSGATPCAFDTLVAVVTGATGGAVVTGHYSAYRS